ncbi:class I SAM-dependent methyltransferase, partial [Candidatus Berkelbacteria bacterium]|nr:class I SAM-dependent methyltransferase [Candidatus Berkelbacteria bacterium]
MNKSEQYRIKACRICRQNNLVEFLSLGSMPIPNGFLKKEELSKEEQHYPLGAYFCPNCTLVQLTHVIPAEIMFKNYLYIPSTSQTMLQHFETLAEEAVEKFEIKPNDLVIDIGSNDGTLLKFFKAFEAQTLGIDPASNLATVARLQGIDTIDAFFTKQLA